MPRKSDNSECDLRYDRDMDLAEIPLLGPDEIGRNIRDLRLRRGMDQESLAKTAGISSRTLRRVESGEGVRARTLARISEALGWDATQARTSVRFLHSRGPEEAYLLHRPEEAVWYAQSDRRRKPPLDALEQIQNPAERRRLGGLGLTSMFVGTLRFNMPGGPGIAFFEIYGRQAFETSDSPYRERFFYCLRGEVTFRFESEAVRVTEGCGINLGRRPFEIEPAPSTSEDAEPPLLMHVGVGWVKGDSARP